MAQQATPPDTSKVIRKLKIHECTINGLFSLPCLPSKIIKKKLTEVNDLVAEIPDDLGDAVFDEWNVKLARWWAQYAERMEKCQQNEPTLVSGLNHSNSSSFVSDFANPQKEICSEIKLAEPITDNIEHQIEQKFTFLPVVTSPTDIEGMKCLLLQISQSLKLSSTLDGNKNSFYCDLFTVAFSKLSTELCEHYLQVTQSASSPLSRLYGLRQFIANQIVKIHNQNSGFCAENSIETIGKQMKFEFSELLKVDNDKCIDQVKCILACVSKARALLLPFRFNVSFNQLQSNLFDLAFSKLPLDLQKECTQVDYFTNQVTKTLTTLTSVLSKHIVGYYAKLRASQAEQILQVQAVVRECSLNGDDAKFCSYCYSVGHLAGQCDQLKSITCFNCLQTGHQAKVCPGDRTTSTFCIECVQFGHHSDYCPTAVCYRCRQFGHRAHRCPN